MAVQIKRVEYYYCAVEDKHGTGYWLLEHLRQKNVNLIAFTAFPTGGGRSQLDFVPDDPKALVAAVKEAGVNLVGPKWAFLVQGQDDVGAIVELHRKLGVASINVHAANGVADGSGRFGYVLWVKPEDYQRAAQVLGA
ncbi:MAG: hypothetical protein AB1772_03505 [Candidatus Zixiibacteriota bacterium]